MKRAISIVIVAVIIAIVTITGCAGKEKPSITLVQNDWTSHVIATEIIDQITVTSIWPSNSCCHSIFSCGNPNATAIQSSCTRLHLLCFEFPYPKATEISGCFSITLFHTKPDCR